MSKEVVHRFLRQPDFQASVTSRIGNRHNPLKNTLTKLEDPQNNRTLYLIGTTNSSTTLAHRTRKLLQEVQPHSLYVQASNTWWDHAKHSTSQTQEEFSLLRNALKDDKFKFDNSLRGILWKIRYALWISSMRSFSRFPSDFTPFIPGLETKFALDEGHKVGSQVHYGGAEFDPMTVEALRTETDMYFHTVLWRSSIFSRPINAWNTEYNDFMNVLHTRGGEAFAESMDRSRINFLVQAFNKVAPKQKSILVDQRDERIFTDIYNIKKQKIVAVVNQWHMQGVETHWRRATGTQVMEEQLSPIADMDIDSYQQLDLVNDYLRDRASKLTKSEPATHQNMITNYHKENFENERTRHTHHSSHEDIPNPGEEPKHH